MKEEWKDIPNWSGIYQCSNFGRVKRFYKHGKQKLLNPFVENGYYHVKLTHNGKEETWKLHRLTATVWLRPLKDNEDVHHVNGLVWCNGVFNLQILPHSIHVKQHWDELKQNGKCKNMKHTGEQKRKMSQAQKGKCLSEEHKRKISETLKGRKKGPMSQQQKRKRSETLKKRYNKINMEVY